MKSISELIQEVGRQKARAYLLRFFENENNLKYFAACFPSHIGSPLPDYQRETYLLIPEAQRLVEAAPRGSGKSTTIDVVVLAYYALFNKSPFSILVSDTLFQSTLHLDALKNELETNEIIQFLFGSVKGDVWGAESIMIKTKYGDSLILAKGAGQQIRGLKFREHRPHLVIVDDLENDEIVESDERRTKLEHWFRYNLLMGLSKDWNKVIMLGTVLHEYCLLKKIIDHKEPYQGWTTRKYQAIKEDGQSFWEKQFPLSFLTSIRDDPTNPEYVGTLVFAQEMQNDPRSDKDRIIKDAWIKTYSSSMKITDEWLKDLKIYGGVDPAISDKEGSSYFSFTTIGIDKEGHIWHLETIRGKISVLEQINVILDCYTKWKHDLIGIESIAYQKVLSQLVKSEGGKREPSVYPSIKELFTDKDKSRRLVLQSSKFEGGFIHLDNDSSEIEQLKKEISAFPAEPNDTIDSLVLALETASKPKARVFAQKSSAF
jgi:hypothetical protein